MPLSTIAQRLIAGATLTLTSAAYPGWAAPPRSGEDLGPARVLAVEAVRGMSTLQRRGDTVNLQQGYLVFNGETVSTREASRLSLALGGHGQMLLGPGTLRVEKLPPAPTAKDLDTRLLLDRGYLHLRWQYEPLRWKYESDPRSWPLTVRLGAWGARVRNGEYHFEAIDGRLLACNVAGSLELYPDTGAGSRVVKSGTCLQLQPGALQVLDASAEDWAVVQRELSLGSLLARKSADPEPTPAPSTVTSVAAVESRTAAPLAVEGGQSPEQLIESAPTAAGATVVSEIAQIGSEVRVIYTEPGAVGDTHNDWIINVVSVRDPVSADDYVKSLMAAGYPARIRRETVRGQPSFRVVVPGIQSGAAADGIAEQLRTQKGFIDAWALQRR